MNLGYLDAGTGSLILQTVLGGAAGLVVFFKTTGRRLFKRGPATTEVAGENQAPTQQPSDT
ncbi:MAG: hypothetical protein OEX04_13515 [Acidimicrobiia bacterium]|nr:hypothetical protein [Acidimicrobiia bacterium]MDH4308488.1 hypothetical protein [Acidimicrobiia bacterium]